MRAIKLLIVFLAIAGTFALVVASRAQARLVTAVSAVAPSMNFGYVRVEGVVPAFPSVPPDGGYLAFTLRDATGELRVGAYGAAAKALFQTGRVPMPGDRVSVEGTLRIRDDEPGLTINAADALSIVRPPPEVIDLAALQAARVGDRVQTSGQVRRARDAGGLRLLTLRQGGAEADLALSLGPGFTVGAALPVAVGDWVSVTAGVGEFRGNRQLLAAGTDDFEPAPDASAREVRQVAGLGRQLVGQWVTVRGVVKEIRSSRAVTRLGLSDGTGDIAVAVFDAWQSVPFSQTLRPGDALLVSGELVDFRGQLELQPAAAFDLTLP